MTMIWGYVGRFTVVHVIVYTLIATIFLIIQAGAKFSGRTATDQDDPALLR